LDYSQVKSIGWTGKPEGEKMSTLNKMNTHKQGRTLGLLEASLKNFDYSSLFGVDRFYE
jgi:hypothetical protein